MSLITYQRKYAAKWNTGFLGLCSFFLLILCLRLRNYKSSDTRSQWARLSRLKSPTVWTSPWLLSDCTLLRHVRTAQSPGVPERPNNTAENLQVAELQGSVPSIWAQMVMGREFGPLSSKQHKQSHKVLTTPITVFSHPWIIIHIVAGEPVRKHSAGSFSFFLFNSSFEL